LEGATTDEIELGLSRIKEELGPPGATERAAEAIIEILRRWLCEEEEEGQKRLPKVINRMIYRKGGNSAVL
jgi:hypothetical protein